MKEDIIVWRVASLLSASRLLSTLFSKHTTFTSEVSATWNYKAKQNKKKKQLKRIHREEKNIFTPKKEKRQKYLKMSRKRDRALDRDIIIYVGRAAYSTKVLFFLMLSNLLFIVIFTAIAQRRPLYGPRFTRPLYCE